MCDHTYCYTPAVMKIREVVQSGMLGGLQFFDSVRINLVLVQSRRAWSTAGAVVPLRIAR
jgi:hypothetical protein